MIKMIDLVELNTELEKFTLEDCLSDKEKLDKLFKLLSIKQALTQMEQSIAQTELFKSMANIQNNIDPNVVNELLKNNSLQDLVSKFSNQ
jgi:hypothetical protein